MLRPVFFDLKSSALSEDFIVNKKQIMIGSSLMAVPVTEANVSEINVLMNEDKFYDYYTGEYVNKDGEGYYLSKVYSNKLPLFVRGGKIIPQFLLEKDEQIWEEMMAKDMLLTSSKLKLLPLQLIIALDSNFQANGYIYIDDFTSQDVKKKIYYKMIITASQSTYDLSVFFRVFSFKHKPSAALFQNKINKVFIYGFNKMTLKRVTVMNKKGRKSLDKNNCYFDNNYDKLTLENVDIPLDLDTKIFIL